MRISDLIQTAGLAGRVVGSVVREKIGPAVRVTDRSHVPAGVDGLTTEWLTSVLCAGVPGTRVVGFEVVGGHAGTSVRRALRVTYDAPGATAGLPTALFTKSTSSLFSRFLLGLTEIADGEAAFYNRVRPALELRSPKAFYAGFDPKTYRAFTILEDLAAAGWTFPAPVAHEVSKADAEDMVCEMAHYHAAFWDSRRFSSDLATLREAYAWQENLNRKVGFAQRAMTGFERAEGVIPASLFARRTEIHPAFMRSLELHRAHPQTLLHQDVHLGNWLRDPDGRIGLYDWQCVARGHWALDVSYALACGLDPDDRREWERDLLRLYLERLAAGGVPAVLDFDTAYLAYRQQVWHGLMFGTFTLGGNRFTPELQPRDWTMKAIGRLATAACDLESLDA